MANWIALFRGINVGGKNILPMKDLIGVLRKSGCTNVQTYIQSGNVVLQSRQTNASTLARQIGDAVFDSHGFQPKVMVLSVGKFQEAVDSNPFPKAEAEPKSLHLFFLSQVPEHPNLEAMNDARSPSESFVIMGKVLYLHAPEGVARSRLASTAERFVGVDATARNWRTVSKILALAN